MKKTITKIISVIIAIVLMCSVFVGCGEKKAEDDKLTVGVIQYISHPSLDNCYQGVENALLAKYGENIVIDRQIGSDASADADCEAYAKSMVANKVDMIVAIATPAASSAYAATEGTTIPVIFCAVSDPVAPGLVASMEEPGDLCSGTSDILDLDAQVEMIVSMQPDVKKIGILYTTSEANSIAQLEIFKGICDGYGIEVIASGVQGAADVPAAAAALVAQVDCLNNFTDNNVVNNLTVVLEAANEAGIPVYGSEVEQVKNGCLSAMSIDYVALGEVTGGMAIDVLEGADISKMAVKTITEATPVVNSEIIAQLNIELPAEYADAEMVTTNK